jgi:hypothetical protein
MLYNLYVFINNNVTFLDTWGRSSEGCEETNHCVFHCEWFLFVLYVRLHSAQLTWICKWKLKSQNLENEPPMILLTYWICKKCVLARIIFFIFGTKIFSLPEFRTEWTMYKMVRKQNILKWLRLQYWVSIAAIDGFKLKGGDYQTLWSP